MKKNDYLSNLSWVMSKSHILEEERIIDPCEFVNKLKKLRKDKFSGYLRIFFPKKSINRDVWIIFKEGRALSVFYSDAGGLVGDIAGEKLVEDVKEEFEFIVYDPEEANFKTTLSFIQRNGSLKTECKKFFERLIGAFEIDRKTLMKKYRLKDPDEQFIDKILEEAMR
ncbi:MAG: DUF2226 domain-containing protein [Candidatus Hydrothermarchaeota archaeon]